MEEAARGVAPMAHTPVRTRGRVDRQ